MMARVQQPEAETAPAQRIGPEIEQVEIVVAHSERTTLRVGEVFLKIDADQARTDVEVQAMALTPIPTARILWHKPPVLALAALPGAALGRDAPADPARLRPLRPRLRSRRPQSPALTAETQHRRNGP